MKRLARLLRASLVAGGLELAGFCLIGFGVYEIYEPAGLVVTGVALVCIAQALERGL